jgi:hypothetical protein
MGVRRLALTLVSVALLALPASALAVDSSGGAGVPGDTAPAPVIAPVAPPRAGLVAIPRRAPSAVRAAVAAGNRLIGKPYVWGGGHQSFSARGYDCSGSVSYVLHAARLLSSPLDSSGLARWGRSGRGRWITIYANRTHAFMVVNGVRLDTSGRPSGPRWRGATRQTAGFTVRHPAGL